MVLTNAISSSGLRKVLEGLFFLFLWISIIPVASVSVRRHHDAGWSGLWVLIPPISALLMLLPSKRVGNPYLAIALDRDGLLNNAPLGGKYEFPDDTQVGIGGTPRADNFRLLMAFASGALFTSLAFILSINTASSKISSSRDHLSPTTIYKSLSSWCDTSVGTYIGLGQVQAQQSNGLASSAVAEYWCDRGSARIYVFFFTTFFDEKSYLDNFTNGMYWQGSDKNNFQSPAYASAGQGYVGILAWPLRNQSVGQTEGQVLSWMAKTFQRHPETSNWVFPSWQGEMPAITKNVFRS